MITVMRPLREAICIILTNAAELAVYAIAIPVLAVLGLACEVREWWDSRSS